MPMEIDRKQLKQRAREAMSLSKPSFWIVTLIYILMTTGVSYLVDLAPGALYLFAYIAYTLYSLVVGFSYRLWALWTSRRLEPGLSSLMEGFSVAGRVIVMELLILLRTLGWTMLFSILAAMLMLGLQNSIFASILLFAAIIAVQIIVLRYSLAPYVLADFPDLGPAVAVAHSVRLTKGWLFELFKLQLSFLGWYVLSFLLSGIGVIIGLLIGGDLGSLMGLPYEELLSQLNTLVYLPVTSLLSNLIALPLTLYLTPYVEVTMAEFYNARISLSDNIGNPLGDMQMPPV